MPCNAEVTNISLFEQKYLETKISNINIHK